MSKPKESLFKLIAQSEVHCLDPLSVEQFFVGDGAAYFVDTTLCWVTLTSAYEDWGHLSLDLACDGPHPDHWFAYEMDCVGLNDMLGFPVFYGEDGDDVFRERWMFEQGVAPGQRFRIAATYDSFVTDTAYGREYDSEIDFVVIAIDTWTNAESTDAWDEYFKWKNAP